MKGSYDAALAVIWAEVLATILRREDLSYAKIAAMHAVSPVSVYRIAHKNKVARKTGRKKSSSH